MNNAASTNCTLSQEPRITLSNIRHTMGQYRIPSEITDHLANVEFRLKAALSDLTTIEDAFSLLLRFFDRAIDDSVPLIELEAIIKPHIQLLRNVTDEMSNSLD